MCVCLLSLIVLVSTGYLPVSAIFQCPGLYCPCLEDLPSNETLSVEGLRLRLMVNFQIAAKFGKEISVYEKSEG